MEEKKYKKNTEKKQNKMKENDKINDNKKGIRQKNKYNKIQDLEHIDFEKNETIIEGRNPVFEALKAKRPIEKIIISNGSNDYSIKRIIDLAKEANVPIYFYERKFIDKLSYTDSHQGVLAYVSAKDYVEIDDIIEIAKQKGEDPFIVILDEIVDVNNLGAIIRTAEVLGAHGIIIPKRRAAGITPTVAKISAGAVEHIAIARVTNLARTIDELKEKNIWIIGSDSSAEKSIFEFDFTGPVAVVIGSEGKGISPLLLKKCDFVLSIPQKGMVSSLNASVAAGIVIYEIFRHRKING